jgi:hypothetical protein
MNTLEQTIIETNCQTKCWRLNYKFTEADKNPFVLTKNFTKWLQEVAKDKGKNAKIMTIAGHTVFFDSVDKPIKKCKKVKDISEAMETSDARSRAHFEMESGDVTGFELDEYDWENLLKVAKGEPIDDEMETWLTECGLMVDGQLSELGKAWTKTNV